jgi:hypothetical protein
VAIRQSPPPRAVQTETVLQIFLARWPRWSRRTSVSQKLGDPTPLCCFRPTRTKSPSSFLRARKSSCSLTDASVFPAKSFAQTPQPGYDKDGKRLVGEKAISPKPEARTDGWRRYVKGTKLTFGIQNIGDVRPPFEIRRPVTIQPRRTLSEDISTCRSTRSFSRKSHKPECS